MKLIIVRHTEVGVEPGICYGCSDVPLADTFEEEAATVLAKLERYSRSWTKIYSSPLTR
ncbi:MAG: histidine phosphatase family protein, partial [Chloroflexota bacterium]